MQSEDYLREYIPDFQRRITEFLKKYGE